MKPCIWVYTHTHTHTLTPGHMCVMLTCDTTLVLLMDFSIFKRHCFKGQFISEQQVWHQRDEAALLSASFPLTHGLFSPIAPSLCRRALYSYDINSYPSAHQPAIITSHLEEFLDMCSLS